MKRRKICSIVLGLVLMFSFVSCKGLGEEGKAEDALITEDFSMMQEEMNPTRYSDLPLAAEEVGFDFYSVKEFSNSYKFSSFSVSDKALRDAKLQETGESVPQVKLTYKHANGVYTINVSACQMEEPEHSVRYEWTKEIEGIPVSLNTYILRFVPNDYELTGEDREFTESGKGSFSCDGVTVGDSYHYTLYFVRDGVYYEFEGAIEEYLPLEEFEEMVTEFLRLAELQMRGDV